MKWFWKICSRSGRSTNNLKRNGQKQFKKKSLTSVSISRKVGQIKGRALQGGFVVFKLLVVLSIIKLYTPDISFLDICKFLVTGILICEMLFFVKWKSQVFVFCVLPLLSNYYGYLLNDFFLWNNQGNYPVNSYINWWKLLTFTWMNTSIKNVSTKVNFFTLERFLKNPWIYGRLFNV